MTRRMLLNNRIALPALLACVLLLLAGAVVTAQLQTGDYQPAALGQLQQSAPAALSTDTRYGGATYPLYPPDLDAGKGQAEVEGYCSMCHSTRYITMQPPLPASAWEATVNKMKNAYGARIPDAAAAQIIQYLQTHYTPETRKR